MLDDTDAIEHASRLSEQDGLLVASLVPDLGGEGLERFAQAVLQRLVAAPTRAVVLDCSALLMMDSHEFSLLARLGEMCRLLSATPYVASLHPGIAIHLAMTAPETPTLQFCRDLDHARALALARDP